MVAQSGLISRNPGMPTVQAEAEERALGEVQGEEVLVAGEGEAVVAVVVAIVVVVEVVPEVE